MIIEHLIGTTTIEVPDIETVVTMEQIIFKENGKIIDGKISLSELKKILEIPYFSFLGKYMVIFAHFGN